MNINEYLLSQRDLNDNEVKSDRTSPVAKRITCADGFSISVQASYGAYCSPRTNVAHWSSVELGFPSSKPNASVMQFAEEPDHPTNTVYAYVPVALVEALIAEHGDMLIDATTKP